jgi:aminoglycoside phosphotransferase (APT) family kinase protein
LTPLAPEIKAWVKSCVGLNVKLLSSQQLRGSSSATLYRLTLLDGIKVNHCVLRLFTKSEWLAVEPDIPEHEAAVLEKVSAAGLPVPHLLGCDPRGAACGLPALLMTALPGKVDLMPMSIESWLRQMAEFLVKLHEIEPAGFHWHYRAYNNVDQLKVPEWSRHKPLWEKAIEIVRSPAPAAPVRFIHRDFHPVNLLWRRGKLSGVVDWVNACQGPAGIDVAWMRHSMASMYGLAMSDRFLAVCQEVMGSSWDYDPYWDMKTIVEFLPGPLEVYPPWKDFGLDHIDSALLTRRDEEYLDSLLKRIE